jgi:type IV secretion system protein TrbL
VLIPFGLFGKSAFMAERVLGNVISSGIKVLILAVIIGIGSTLFSEFTSGFGGQNPSIDEAMAIVLAALSLLGLGIFGPGIASGIVSAVPSSAPAQPSAQVSPPAAWSRQASARSAQPLLVAPHWLAVPPPPPVGAPRSRVVLPPPTALAQPGSPARLVSLPVSAALPALAEGRCLSVASGRIARRRKHEVQLQRRWQSSFRSNRRYFHHGLERRNAAGDGAASAGPANAGGPPAWAQRMKRSQHMTHAVQGTAHAVRSGDSPRRRVLR